jgi:hypothetical protein
MQRREFLAVAAAVPSLFGAEIPRPAPLKTYPAPGGGKIDLAAYKGKVIAVEFLNTGCPSCQRCARALQKMHTQYGPRGLQVVGLATNATNSQEAASLIGAFRAQLQIGFPIGWCNEEEFLSFLQIPIMAPRRVPQLAFVDKKGMIRAQYQGTDPFFFDEENNLRRTIESLLKEPAGASTTRKGPRSTAPDQ